jgi:hypothetical protein
MKHTALRPRFHHCIHGQRIYLNTVAPPWIIRTRVNSLKIINQLELSAVLTCGYLLKGRQVWFWCDKTTALSAVIHGYARSAHLAHMTIEIHLLFARLQITAWFEWVPTNGNTADVPSRPQGQACLEFSVRCAAPRAAALDPLESTLR